MQTRSVAVVLQFLFVAVSSKANVSEDKASETVDSSLEGFKCGPVLGSAACYPRRWKSFKMVEYGPCTGECDGDCRCSNSKESCVTVGRKNPGLIPLRIHDHQHYFAVKVNKATKEWQYLNVTEEWSGDDRLQRFRWESPSDVGKSFVDLAMVGTTHGAEGDDCDPGIMAKYIEQQFGMFSSDESPF